MSLLIQIMRNAYIDNAKGILILLVVAGHIGSLFFSNYIIFVFTTIIYVFHIPAFALITGYNTRITDEMSYQFKTIKIFVYFIVFNILYSCFHFLLNGQFYSPILVVPYNLMWFLLSMALWRIIYRATAGIPHKYSIPASFIVAILAGLLPQNNGLPMLLKTVTFYPFFLVGAFLQAKTLNFASFQRYKFVAGILLAGVAGSLLLVENIRIVFNWFIFELNYQRFGLGAFAGMILKVISFTIIAICCACLFTLIPQKKGYLTIIGKYSLSIYLLHMFFILFALKPNIDALWFVPVILISFYAVLKIDRTKNAGMPVKIFPLKGKIDIRSF